MSNKAMTISTQVGIDQYLCLSTAGLHTQTLSQLVFLIIFKFNIVLLIYKFFIYFYHQLGRVVSSPCKMVPLPEEVVDERKKHKHSKKSKKNSKKSVVECENGQEPEDDDEKEEVSNNDALDENATTDLDNLPVASSYPEFKPIDHNKYRYDRFVYFSFLFIFSDFFVLHLEKN